jgi:import inner membrane translocase subunit TIM22
VECCLATLRGRHDIKNPVIGGCITGGLLAYNQGPVAILMGCGGFAAFSLVIEQFMHAGGHNPFMMGLDGDDDDDDPHH